MSEKHDVKTRIKQAIEACTTDDLSQGALHLLKTLGYSAPRLNYFTKRSFAEFEENFSGNTERFSKKSAQVEQWKSVDVLFQLTGNDLGAQQGIFQNEQVDNTIIESYLFFVLELKPKKDNAAYTRTELSQITREVNKCFAMPAMILFKTGDTLSFAVIDRRLHKRESSKDVLEKVTLIKDIRTTGPHRAHIEILFDLGLEQLRKKHDVPNFPKLHEAWRKTLDTKELNKRFFRELSNWYFHAVEVTQWPADAEPDRDKRNAINTIRLITRLMFVWFLREKNLVPDALFDTRELKKILRSDVKEKSLYYKAILQNLFFATLNTEMGDKRRFRIEADRSQSKHYFIHNVFRYERCFSDPKSTLKNLFAPIPFLNGGLFECLDKQVEMKGKLVPVRVDGFSDRDDNPLLVPDKLFFDPEGEEYDFSEVYGSKKARKEKVRGLIDILSSYKFTITENTPIEEEVALDPELLGKVFENLLANYNPETKTTARKQTGSFYTPREIVNYMVDESLIAYLKTSLGDVADVEARLRHLLSYTEEAHQFTKAETEKLIAAIDTCKILDPACGSGAFPMGVLHKLVHVLHKLDPQNKQWKERQVEKATLLDDADIRERTIADIEDAFANNALDYGRKLYLIENGIYGVDIQPIAMQIAKLRFFISLVVDQRVDARRPNLGVRPLPNLETKFVAANTLMKLKPREQMQIFDTEGIDELKDQLKRVRHDYFEARTPQRKAKCREQDKLLREKLAALLMQNQGYEPEEAKMLASWDPYDQNASAPFFDPEWMFGLSDGASIVIGNPPYVEHKKLKPYSADLRARYSTYSGTGDLYVYFYEHAVLMLRPGGVLAFISSNKFMRTSYGMKLRQMLSSMDVLSLAEFADVHVFDALVDSCVVVVANRKRQAEYVDVLKVGEDLVEIADFLQYAKDNTNPLSVEQFGAATWQLVDMGALAIKSKIEENTTELGNLRGVRIFRGITTGYNPAYVLPLALRNELVKSEPKSKVMFHPLVQGRNIKKWAITYGDDVLLYVPWHFPLHNDSSISGSSALAEKAFKDNHPVIYSHLRGFLQELSARNADETGIRYEWYALQRAAASYVDEFSKRKIVWALTSDNWGFAIDEKHSFLPSNGYLLTSEETSLEFLIALLNSRLFEYYFGFIGIMTAGGAFTMKQETISALPIRHPSPKVNTQLEKLVEKRLGLEAGTAAEAVEREIDQVVYGLYGLTEEEIRIVEGSVKRKGGAAAEVPNGQDGEEATEASTPRKRGRPRKG